MTCALDTYRVSVGNFAFVLCKILSRKADIARKRIKGLRLNSFAAKLTLATLLTLLIIGGVEVQPGPNNSHDDSVSQQTFESNMTETNVLASIQSTLLSLQEAVSRVETTQNKLESSLGDRLKKLIDEKVGPCMEEVRSNQEIIQGDIDELANRQESLVTENEQLHSRISELEDKLDMAENRSRRNNLLFWGIPTQVKETWDDCERKVLDIIHNTMGIVDDVLIERAHRVGKAIIVAFQAYKDRQLVLSHGSKPKGTNVYVNEDFSESVCRKRQGLSSLRKSLKADGKKVVLSFDKLKTDDGTPSTSPPTRFRNCKQGTTITEIHPSLTETLSCHEKPHPETKLSQKGNSNVNGSGVGLTKL